MPPSELANTGSETKLDGTGDKNIPSITGSNGNGPGPEEGATEHPVASCQKDNDTLEAEAEREEIKSASSEEDRNKATGAQAHIAAPSTEQRGDVSETMASPQIAQSELPPGVDGDGDDLTVVSAMDLDTSQKKPLVQTDSKLSASISVSSQVSSSDGEDRPDGLHLPAQVEEDSEDQSQKKAPVDKLSSVETLTPSNGSRVADTKGTAAKAKGNETDGQPSLPINTHPEANVSSETQANAAQSGPVIGQAKAPQGESSVLGNGASNGKASAQDNKPQAPSPSALSKVSLLSQALKILSVS